MKRFIKIFLLVLITLSFNINVYAECFRIPVGDKQIVIPDGWFARCTYENISGSGSLYKRNVNLEYVMLDFLYDVTKNDGTIKMGIYGAIDGDIKLSDTAYMSALFETYPLYFTFKNGQSFRNETSSGLNDLNLDGLTILKDGSLKGAHFDGDGFMYSSSVTDGCPEYFSWTVDGYKNTLFKFDNTSSISTDSNGSYSMYKLIKYNDNFDPVFEDEEPIDHTGLYLASIDGYMHQFRPSRYKIGGTFEDDFQEELNKCTNVKTPELNGEEQYVVPGEKVIDTITCPYYFEFIDEDGKTCTKTYVDSIFDTTYTKDPYTYDIIFESFTHKYNYNNNLSQLQFANMNEDITNVENAINSNTSYEGDYVNYDKTTKKISCSTKNVYMIMTNNLTDKIVFGQSLYNSYVNSYKGFNIFPSLTEPSGKCLADLTQKPEDNNDDFDWDFDEDTTCEGVLGKDLIDFMNKIFRWICIIAPIIVIVLGSVDFAGAVLQDDKDALKKASTKFVKRLIIAIALFFIPIFLNFLFDIYHEVTGKTIVLCKIWR